MLQGDICIKQQKLCGQRWRSIFNFTARFYAVEIHEDTRPYLAFYDERKGFLTYGRMPFGLTGAPTCFNEMTACELGDLKTSYFSYSSMMAVCLARNSISTLLTFTHYWTEYATESGHFQPT